MPLYEYRCPKGHLYELFQRMDDAPPEVCEVCGASPLEKVLHPVPIFFKGKGFYSTDYGRGGRKRDTGKDGDSSSAESSPSEGKSDEKKKPDKPEKKAAEASKAVFQKALAKHGMRDAITTEILDAPAFYYAEDYHQQYLAKNPMGYCGLGGTGVSCPIGVGVAAE